MTIFISREWHGFEIPDDARPRKHFQQVIGDVNFPPIKTLTRGAHVTVMIIVPAFAEGDEREDETVAAGVIGFVSALAQQMRERIDARSRVKQNRGADEKSPDEQLPRRDAERREKFTQKMSGGEQRDGEEKRHERIKAVQENQFGKFREVADMGIVRGKIPRAGNPADVRPPESMLLGRVGILLFVRMFVMMAMLVTPPQRAALNSGRAKHGKEKLRRARRGKCFMGKVAMIKPGDGKHPHQIQHHRRADGEPAPAREKNSEAAEVQKNKRQHADEFHFVRLGADGGNIAVAVVGVEPVNQRNKSAL